MRKMKIYTILAGIGITIFVLLYLGGCAAFCTGMMYQTDREAGPDKEEYVGVWACYRSEAGDAEDGPDSLDDVRQFIRLKGKGEAQQVICSEYSFNTIDCNWIKRNGDSKTNEKPGVVLIGDDFENPYSYLYWKAPDNSLVDEPLMEGSLYINFGHRKDYFEKISNDPDYQPWVNKGLPSGSHNPAQEESTGITNDSSETGLPDGAVGWDKASAYIGETAVVCGPVVGAEYAKTSNGRPTFLDIGASYPDANRVTVTIWGQDRSAFSPSPEAMYEGKNICVTGEIYSYKGVCNIEVTSPSQITVID